MTEKISLLAMPRTIVGKKVKRIRREGWVPIVLYGPGFEPEVCQANGLETDRAVIAAGMTNLISLQVEGHQEPYRVLVRDVQRDVLTDALIHVDLYRVSMTQEITTEIPIEFVNESPLVTEGTAILLSLMDRVEVECLPDDLVSSLELDLSLLQSMDDVLHVKDLPVPERVTVLAGGDGVVARLTHVSEMEIEEEEEEEELLVEVAADEVEVIAKGKTEDKEELPFPAAKDW